MNIAIIIPALNEEGNIQRLIAETPTSFAGVTSQRIIVVNNGSDDNTAEAARAAGAVVVDEPRRGYGYACAAGTQAATDADVLVYMDGDGSFDPAEIALLLAPIIEDEADMVLGSRAQFIEAGAMAPHQRLGNRMVAGLTRLLYGLQITDLGPFRAIQREHVLAFDMQEMTFGWPTEMLVKAARADCRIVEVPVHYRKRWSGQSKVSGTVRGSVLAAYFILGVTLRYAFFQRNH